MCLAGREPQPLSGKAQEEEESGGGMAAPAALGFTTSVTQGCFDAVGPVLSTSSGQARENINHLKHQAVKSHQSQLWV